MNSQTKSSSKNQRVGRRGEDMASRYLSDNNFVILERNWKCKCGEADIIAEEEGTLVFIEVKTRSSASSGLPEDAVTRTKRARYERIAISYLAAHRHPSCRVRFDVIAIVLTGEACCLLRHHRDAFAAGE
jgi:putative endonuclease